jgi:hypothetical protein
MCECMNYPILDQFNHFWSHENSDYVILKPSDLYRTQWVNKGPVIRCIVKPDKESNVWNGFTIKCDQYWFSALSVIAINFHVTE